MRGSHGRRRRAASGGLGDPSAEPRECLPGLAPPSSGPAVTAPCRLPARRHFGDSWTRACRRLVQRPAGRPGIRSCPSLACMRGRLVVVGGGLRALAPLPDMDALHIAFVADTFDGAVTGGTRSAVRFVHALRRQHEVVVLATGGRDEPDRVVLPGFQLPVRAMRGSGFMMAFPRRSTLEAVLADADVVHLQFPFWLSFAALACARRAGTPVVAAFHVQPENLLLNVGLRSRRLSHAIYRFWVSRLYNRADAVVCPSPFAEEKLRSQGLAVPSFVVSNGLSPAIRRRCLPREPHHEGTFLVLMVGRLAAEKRHDVMFEALARARHRDRIRLVVAGAGPRERELRRRALRLPHPPEISFVSDQRLERLYNTADLFVHCSE
ncbi:MAG: glycosyltransferase family 4 protein, partial [Deltaproteobacteria bacterium]